MESSFLISGLLIARDYLKEGNAQKQALAGDIDRLWREMEFDWYLKGGEKAFYWHRSFHYGWEMNLPIAGYNECLIAYVLGASSPIHPIPAVAYREGWATDSW